METNELVSKRNDLGKINWSLFLIISGISLLVGFIVLTIIFAIALSQASADGGEGFGFAMGLIPIVYIVIGFILVFILGILTLIANKIKNTFRTFVIPIGVTLLFMSSWWRNSLGIYGFVILPLYFSAWIPVIYFLFINKETKILRSKKLLILFGVLIFISLIVASISITQALNIMFYKP